MANENGAGAAGGEGGSKAGDTGAGEGGAAAAAAARKGAGDGGAGAGDGKGGQGTGAAADGKGAAAAAAGDGKAGAGDGKAGGTGDGAAGDGVKGDWPDDWRTKLAGGDEKVLKRLDRFASPLAVRDALFAAQDKIRSGQVKSKLPENASADEVKAWRADNGIPDAPEGYDVSLGEGHVWGEADKPLLASFTKAAHEANVPPEHVKPLLKWYDKLQEQQAEARQNADAQWKKDNVDELRKEFGEKYRAEVRIVDEFFEALPDGLGEVLLNARDAEGRPLGANAKLLRWANQMQREANPASTVMPGGGPNSMQAMTGEIDKLKGMMADRGGPYWKGPEAAKHQARYRELVDARDRSAKRAA